MKISGRLWQYYRYEPALYNNNNIIDFSANNNNSISFKFKRQIRGQIGNGGTNDIEIMDPLKYLSKFCRTLKMSLINCEINLQLKWSEKCISVTGTAANQVPKFETDAKLYIPVVILSTQDNVKLLKQLKSGFKRTFNWNKDQSKKTNQAQIQIFRFFN